MLDKGEDEPSTALDFIRQKNPYFTYETEQLNIKTYIKGFYKGKSVIFVLNNNSLKDTIDVDDKVLCNYERLAGLLSNEIETVTVCETEGLSLLYGGKSGSEVVIFIYNYKDFHVRTTSAGIRTTKLDGYTYSREFYNPNYSNSILPEGKDYRRTLYWNPDVQTDNNGKATISFYNNSSCKTLNVSAETVTEDGFIGVLNK